MARGDLVVDVVAVERTVGGGGGNRTIDLVEQGAELRVVVVVIGQRRRDDPVGVGVPGEVQKLWGGAERGAPSALDASG
jgi:hypothetical protein